MKVSQKPAFCFLLLICAHFSFSQQGHLLFHHLNVRDGLSQPDNCYVYKDSRGFVWISSVSGLNRFDGTSMKVYMPDATDPRALYTENIQSNFFEDTDRNLWFCNYDAVQMYDWREDCFDYYIARLDTVNKIGYHIFHRDTFQNLWIIVQDSLLFTFRPTDKEFHFITNIHRIASRGIALADDAGRVKEVWLYHKGSGDIIKMEFDDQGGLASQETILKEKEYKDFIRKIITRRNDEVWVLGNKALYQFQKNSPEEKIIPINIPDPICLEWMNDSILLVGFLGNGLWEFNTRSLQFTHQYISLHGDNLSLQSNSIQYLNRDRDGGIWASIRGVGISYAYPQKKKFETYFPFADRKGDKEFEPVALFPLDKDRVWCATNNNGIQLIQLEGASFTMSPVKELGPDNLPGQLAIGFRDGKNNFWLSSFQTFVVIEQENKVIHSADDMSKTFFYSGVTMANGDVLLSTQSKSLQRAKILDNNKLDLQPLPNSSDIASSYTMYLDRQGRLWLNDNLQGFIVLDTVCYERLATLPMNVLAYNLIESKDGRTIWITTSTGLYKINAIDLKIETRYDHKQGMPMSSLTAMEMDNDGRIWLSYNKGILMFDPVTNRCRTYNEDDGLSPYEYKDVSYHFDDDEMWFGATGAITMFYPDKIQDIQVTAIPQISEIQINDAEAVKGLSCEITGSTNITEMKKLTFRHRQNTLSFRLHALEYSAPRQNKVRYKMKDLDEHEIEVSNGSLVRYPNMPAGDFHLLVYASNSDGVFNPVPHDLNIIMIPPFHKTFGFIVLMAILGGSILGYIIYLRFSKVVELQRVRLKLYENLHDDVGSRLTAMVMSIEDLERNREKSPYRLESIAQIARSVVGNMRRLVWAIDPENDKMNSIIQKITYDQSMMVNKDSTFHIEANEYTRNLAVPGELRYQISSICTEALNNISKYAKATEVNIRIHAEKNRINLTITDNGIGFNPDEKTKDLTTGSGYGLNNMKRRASRVKGILVIHSKPGEGTRIEASFPY